MSVIYKYKLEITDVQRVPLRPGAKILTVQMQNGVPCLWALVDEPFTHSEYRTIYIVPTGVSFQEVGRYIATFQTNDGALVFHVFEGAHQ